MGETTTGVSNPAIQVRGLSKSFGSSHALRDIDLDVDRGERLVVFGPNGAGKTTLVKILSTLMKPSSGSIVFDGTDAANHPRQIRRRIALVSHQTFLYDDLTVDENLRFYGKMYDVPGLEGRIDEVIAWAHLEPRRHDRAGTLSRGLQQRVSIARAILHNPPLLLLDEPETGLDPGAGTMIADLLKGTGSDSRTVVMTSHNLERGLELGDSVIILDRGRIVYRAPAGDAADLHRLYDRYTGRGDEKAA